MRGTRYVVELRGARPRLGDIPRHEGNHFVVGLPGVDDASILVHRGDGDFRTRMETKEQMHEALYDLFQVRDELREGDEFETEFGLFSCRSVHVLDEEETARWDARHA